MISFVVPAHNEQACLARTLQAIHESARAVGQPYEIVVANDASTDATAEIAQQNGARMVNVSHRQIAATRNSGGRAANGDRLFFVDADTIVNPRAIKAAMRAMDKGAVGGGGPTWFNKNESVPLYIRLIALLSIPAVKLISFSGGAFMFCTREAFHASGGFNEKMFWGEEGSFALALKRQGRFVGLWQWVHTSGRRFRKTSALELFLGGIRMIFSPLKMVTQRSSVEKIWYDSNRTDDDKMPSSVVAKISNGIALLLLIVLITGPLWNFVPRALTPWESPFGKFRIVCATILCHTGLIFWPFAIVLFVNLLRQRFSMEWIKMSALIAFCVWQGWGATRGVIWLWTELGYAVRL
jgi:glycosyltransferase involved in cell wall biosynthesis